MLGRLALRARGGAARGIGRACSSDRGSTAVANAARDANWRPKPQDDPSKRSLLPDAIVRSPYTKLALPVIGHTSYITLASGFLMTDVLALRALLICGYSGLVAFHTLHERPLRIPLSWSFFFVFVNSAMAIILARDRYPGSFDQDQERLYQESFSQLTRGQFKRLMGLANIETVPAGTTLTVERSVCNSLYFVLDGCARMKLNGEHVALIEPGGFCNTLAYQRGEDGAPSYGTIVTQTTTRVVRWPLPELRRLVGKDVDLERRFNHVLVTSLMRRLLRSRDGAVVQDYLGQAPRLRPSYTEQHEALMGMAPGGGEVGSSWGRYETQQSRDVEGEGSQVQSTTVQQRVDGRRSPTSSVKEGECHSVAQDMQGPDGVRQVTTGVEPREVTGDGLSVERDRHDDERVVPKKRNKLMPSRSQREEWERISLEALAHTHPEPSAVPDSVLPATRPERAGEVNKAGRRDEPGTETYGSGPAEENEVVSWRNSCRHPLEEQLRQVGPSASQVMEALREIPSSETSQLKSPSVHSSNT